jgi:predicted TPR repeat methyltransferase
VVVQFVNQRVTRVLEEKVDDMLDMSIGGMGAIEVADADIPAEDGVDISMFMFIVAKVRNASSANNVARL